MSTISDLIENFLLETLGDDSSLNINRNELAAYFSVSPSQINYVLTTRFTPERGYYIQSRRGGGGYVTVSRLGVPDDIELRELVENAFADGISFAKAAQLLDRLASEGVITQNESTLIKAAVTDKALIAPTVIKEKLRGSVLKSVVMEILKLKQS